MARKHVTDMSAWPSLSLEGNLIAPAMVEKIDRREASEQTEDGYGIRKGLTIREEISLAFRVGQTHFDAFTDKAAPSAESTRRFARGFLNETFGFDDLAAATDPVALIAGQSVPIVVVPPSESLDRRSPTLSTDKSRSATVALQDYLNEHDEALWGVVTNGTHLRLLRDNASLTRPAHIEADLNQIFTNEDAASFAALWLIVHRSRFGKEGRPATDCALERWRDAGAREGEAARYRLASQVEIALRVLGSGFLEANGRLATEIRSGEVPLTTWFNEILRLVYRLIFLMVAEDRDLLHPINAGNDARKLYADGYSLAALRAQSVRGASWDRHHDRYEGMKVVFRALATGEQALALPNLGGFFAADQLPNLESARLPNSAYMEAVYRLAWVSDRGAIVPVNWRAMETEEFGSVYESLLELQPQLTEDGRALVFASAIAEKKGHQRKTTGSYYTPDSLVQALLDTALDPVLDRTEAEAEDPEKALLDLTVIDPACGSGHFLLAAARRIATRVARIRSEGTPSLADFRHALRDAVRHCIYGVDRNPMAVELTKVALWIETVDPGFPLGFFDAQIRCGDSLLGVFDLGVLREGIPDAAYKPLTGDDKVTAKDCLKANRDPKRRQGAFEAIFPGRGGLPAERPRAAEFSKFRGLPEDTIEQIAAKAARYGKLRERPAFICACDAADLYVAAFLAPKTGGGPNDTTGSMVPTTNDVWMALAEASPRDANSEATTIARRACAFHWPLEFPDIMSRGGFDVVLGNPPWERIKLQEQEFFAARSPEIADAPNKAARARLIRALEAAPEGSPEQLLHTLFIAAKRTAEAISEFVRVPKDEGGRFPLTGRGDVNTYALFAETFSHLARERAGVIVPTGIATDATTAPFFAALVKDRQLAKLVDFENRAGLFPAVDSRMKFCLLTLGRNEDAARFAFFLTDPAQLAEPERNFTLSPEQIAAINPNTRTAPVFRSRADAELTAKIYSNAPVLIDESKGPAGNPWGVSFMAMFHMSNDSALFRTAGQLAEAGFVRDGTDWVRTDRTFPAGSPQPGTSDVARESTEWIAFDPPPPPIPASASISAVEDVYGAGPAPLARDEPTITRYVPLYEAKMTSFFDHRFAGYGTRGEVRGYRVLPETSIEEHTDPNFEPEPYYWVAKFDLIDRLESLINKRWFVAWKDVSSATNERTATFSILPRVAVGHSMPLLFSDQPKRQVVALYCNLNSLIVDYVARSSVAGLHLTYSYLKQFPLFSPAFHTELRLKFVIPRALTLTYTSHALASFASDLGYGGPPFDWDEELRAQMRADLDAFYARAYRLTRDELCYILDPIDIKGSDYPSETFRVLKAKEIRQFGEYRTRRLVLAAWARMEANGEFTELGL